MTCTTCNKETDILRPSLEGQVCSDCSKILKALQKRDSKMYHYYKATFEDDFEGGYPIEWDEEFIKEIT